MQFFTWLENSAFSMWVKDPDTLFGYNLFLASHAVGMAVVVGISTAFALRILGFAPGVPLAPLQKFFPIMYAGFWINALPGFVLFVIYPTKPITNPGFYVKMSLIVLALLCLRRLRRYVFTDRGSPSVGEMPANARMLAAALIFVWIGVITAGRLMAYHGVANVEWEVSLGMTILAVAALLVGFAIARKPERKPAQMEV